MQAHQVDVTKDREPEAKVQFPLNRQTHIGQYLIVFAYAHDRSEYCESWWDERREEKGSWLQRRGAQKELKGQKVNIARALIQQASDGFAATPAAAASVRPPASVQQLP